MVLILFSEGTMQFAAKKDIDTNKKSVLLKDFPKDSANPNLSYINFKTDDVNQTLKFSTPCSN